VHSWFAWYVCPQPLGLWPSGFGHTCQANPSCPCYNYYMYTISVTVYYEMVKAKNLHGFCGNLYNHGSFQSNNLQKQLMTISKSFCEYLWGYHQVQKFFCLENFLVYYTQLHTQFGRKINILQLLFKLLFNYMDAVNK